MGWRMFSTPAITKADLRAAAGEQPRDGPPEQEEHGEMEEARAAKFHNSGGEAILVNPSRVATGYHQPKEACGYRSALLRFQGWTLHLITCYFDCGWPLEAGPNAEKWKQIQGLITAIDLPWILVGDFNRTPGEVANSLFVKFLKGIVVAPRVPFTCVSPSTPGGGRVIEMVVACADIAYRLRVEPHYDHDFRPHIVGLAISLDDIMDSDEAYVQDLPDEIMEYPGPRMVEVTWEAHVIQHAGTVAQLEVPWNSSANRAITDLYARWSRANESYWLSIFPDASDRHVGRGSKVSFRKVNVSFDNQLDHIYIKPALSFWERLGNALRVLRGLINNGATEEQMQTTRGRLGNMMKMMQQYIPTMATRMLRKPKDWSTMASTTLMANSCTWPSRLSTRCCD